ncbi:MAG: DUF1223 domain-containing protein [Sphingomonas sp.]
MRSLASFKSSGVALIGAMALGAGGCADGATPARHPVVVELFTSQGCSSCPPADAIMARLAQQAGVVAITRPVTYWDRFGWKDTLARPANTQLQQAYAARHILGAGVYTPQAVIDGRTGTVGGREAQINALIAQAAKAPAPALVIDRTADGGRVARLDGKTATPAIVSLVALRGLTTVAVGRGENRGRSVAYANAVISEAPLGRWAGGAKQIAVAPARLHVPGAARYALLVRQGAAGPILAASYL